MYIYVFHYLFFKNTVTCTEIILWFSLKDIMQILIIYRRLKINNLNHNNIK